MGKVLFLESVAGVAGDMFAAAFLDAGLVTIAELAALPAQLGFDGVSLDVRTVAKATIKATHLRVVVADTSGQKTLGHVHPISGQQGSAAGHTHAESETHLIVDAPADHHHTHYVEIDRRIAESRLAPAVRELARTIFRLLAEAEAAAHGADIAQVAFHEIGSIDSIVDVVMAAYCVAHVGPARWVASPIRPGRGFVKIAHGQQPVPPPASARLLADMPVAGTPAAITRENVELSTPTGIAILKALAPEFRGEIPAGIVRHHGMGAGTMDLGSFPNVFRVFLIEEAAAPAALPYETDRVIEVACNIDDDTGEHVAWLAAQLMERGALDVWLGSATGKKGRPMVLFSMVASEDKWTQLADWLLRHSTTFGVRHRTWDRLKLARRFESRPSGEGEVTYKVGLTIDGEVVKEKAEFEELRQQWEQRKPDGT